MPCVVVHADDRPAVARGPHEVCAIAAAHVEHAIAAAEVRQVPVRATDKGEIDEVLGMDRVAALAGELDEPHADGLAAPVHDVDRAHDEAPNGCHRRDPAARRRHASSVAS